LRVQPNYHFFKNTKYALDGLKDILSTETSFKIEIIVVFALSIFLIFWDIEYINRVMLFSSMMLVLIVEALNSAIERVVDLVTKDYHDLAKRAKDAGSSAVFLSIATASILWSVEIFLFFI
jgi:diacylglycerol kinase (ATP)